MSGLIHRLQYYCKELLSTCFYKYWKQSLFQPGGAPHSFVVTFLRCSQQLSVFPKPTLWWVWKSVKINHCIIFSRRDLALVLLREGERRFLKSRSGLTSTSCDPYYKHTVKYLASDLPRRWFRDEDKPVFHEWFRLRCFAFTHYIMQRTEGSFLTTSLQNLICIIYAQYPQSAH